jgi:transcriptional regulator of acetoin/glycerol metabolism
MITVDTRVVAASNRDLKEAIRRGEFREELYYRLNMAEIRMPPKPETDDGGDDSAQGGPTIRLRPVPVRPVAG